MNINNRLKQYLEENKISFPYVYQNIGASRMEFNSWISLGRPIPSGRVQSIIELFPDMSARWFITGKGEMMDLSHLSNDKVVLDRKEWEEYQNNKQFVDLLKDQNLTLKAHIKDLQTTMEYKQVLFEDQIKNMNTLFAQFKSGQ